MTGAQVWRAFRGVRLPMNTEAAAQAAALTALEARFGDRVQREVYLSVDDRPDFMVEGVAVELKIKGSATAIYRQLERYAAHDAVTAIVLVTGRAMGLPEEIGGKPAFVVSMGGAWL